MSFSQNTEPPKNQNVSTSIYTQDPGESGVRIFGLELVLLKRIIHLGWPVVIGMLSQTAINTVDLIFIGHLPSEIAVPGTAAVLSSIILLWGFGGFLSAISVGTLAISARRFSEGRLKHAGQVLTNALLIAICSSIVVTIIAQATLIPFMKLLTPDLATEKEAISYCGIRLWGLISMATMSCYKSFYDSMGRVRIHMTVAILMNIANAILSYCFIFGFSIFGITLEPMYVEGAALGALITSFLGLFIIIGWSLRHSDRVKFNFYSLKNISLKVTSSVARLSIWSGFATLILMIGVGAFNYIIASIDKMEGTGAINSSAASIVIHVMMLVFMSCLAFGTSTATLVSQSIGAKNTRLAERYGWQSVLLCLYFFTAAGIIAFFFPEVIMRFFMPKELNAAGELKDAVVTLAIPSLKLAVLVLAPLSGAGMILTQALYGAGKTRFVMIVEFILHFGCLIPLAWFLAIYLEIGLFGCWIAGVVYAAILLLATAIQFGRGTWKHTVL